MKKIIYCFLLLSFGIVSCKNKKTETQTAKIEKTVLLSKNTPLANCDFSKLENGDILLKCGFGMISKQISSSLQEEAPLSHCAIFVKEKDSTYIIHSVAGEIADKDGVQTITLNNFIKDTKEGSFFVLRLKSDKASRDKIVMAAKKVLADSVKFDYDLNLKDTTRMYCAELLKHSLERATSKNIYTLTKPVGDKNVLLFNPLIKDTLNFENIVILK